MKQFLAFTLLVFLMSCNDVETSKNDKPVISESLKTEVPNNPIKEAYFGETHMHSMYSLDAYIGGNRMSPEQSLKFAQGEALKMEKFGKSWQLKRPLDFAAVTDHAEYIGEAYSIITPGAAGYDSEPAKEIRGVDNLEDGLKLFVKYVVSNNRSATPSQVPGVLSQSRRIDYCRMGNC